MSRVLHFPTNRNYLLAVAAIIAGAIVTASAWAAEPASSEDPRAVYGDAAEPNWDEAMTITVGPASADLVGATDKSIQAAVDYIARRGGGTVRLGPGIYQLRNSIFLQSGVRLLGEGEDTKLIKDASATTSLTVDGDHWDQEVTLQDPAGFEVGDGVRLVAQDPHGKGTNIVQRTLVARKGYRFKLDQRLGERFHLSGDPRIATNFALIQGTDISDAVVENLLVDGNKALNEMLDKGAFDDGAIRFDQCNRITVRGVTVRNFYCDGIVWGISHDLLVERCRLLDGARLAIHAGSGSRRSIVRDNTVTHCAEGVYFCWGAQRGLYERNLIDECGYGMTFGHSDSDNLIRNNEIRNSLQAGIFFRGSGGSFGPHRNRFENNRIINSGGEDGAAIDITGDVDGVEIVNNHIEETRGTASRSGIRIAEEVKSVRWEGNEIEGVAHTVTDHRAKKPAGAER